MGDLLGQQPLRPAPLSLPPSWHQVRPLSLKREEACHPASPSWRTMALDSGFLVSLPSCRGAKGF